VKTIALDVLGLLLQPGATEEDPPTALPGWHVNASAPVQAWEARRVYPAQPRRVFGGGETVFYTFPSQADYEAALPAAVLERPDEEAPAVPRRVTMRQARRALHQAGLLQAVEDAIDALPDPPRTEARVEWEHSQEVWRERDFVVLLGGLLGLTTEQMDALFISAESFK